MDVLAIKRVRFETLGCRLNQSETEVLQRSFEKQGYRLVDETEDAQVCVVNTCTVTEQADAKNRKLIRALHRQHPKAVIAVVGCYAQMAAEELAEMEGVRLVVGNQEKMQLVEHMAATEDDVRARIVLPRGSRRAFQTPVLPRQNVFAEESGKQETRNGLRTRASLKIQDGCDFMCSFCIIPFARGRSRYRNFGNIMAEAEMLAREGVREIVFTGVNIGTYREAEKTILDVIDSLNVLEGLARIRISSIEPTTVPEGVLERMADPTHKLMPFLHLPVQSGSDSILGAMKRRYRAKDFAREVENAWKQVPGLCIGTDVMVGFPGETDHQYQQTRDLLIELPLTYFHVFLFSARKGTPAYRFQEKARPQEVQRRGAELRELSMRKRKLAQERMLDTLEEVLFEARKPDGTQSGYTPSYARVTLQNNGAKDHRNRILPVRITYIKGSQVFGRLEI